MAYIHNEKPLVASGEWKGDEQGHMAVQPRN